MDKNIKTLFITPQFPFPLDNGGKIGALNGIITTSSIGELVVLSFTEEPSVVREGISYYSSRLKNVSFIKPIFHNIHIRKKYFKLIKTLLIDEIFGIPYVSAKYINHNMLRCIDEMFKVNKYWNLIFVDYLNMAFYGNYIRNKYRSQYDKLILKDHNIEYEIVEQAAKNSKGIKKWYLFREARKTENYEKVEIKNADLVYSVCNTNTEYMLKYNERSYTMLPSFEMIKTKKKCQDSACNLLYIGNLSWEANREGIRWFIDKVFPYICKKYKDAKLTIVGGGLDFNPYANNKNINYLGYVKDLTNIYDDQLVFVVPLFEGSGIRIKILEAFNNEIAVVSTKIGCETVGATDKEEIMIADNEMEFVSAIEELIESKTYRNTIITNAKAFLMKNYSIESRQAEYIKIIKELI